MKLPIYRHLSQRLEIFGLSPLELGILCLVFVVLNDLVPHFPFAHFFVLSACLGMALLLRHLHRKFESNYIEKFLRYAALPDQLDRKLMTPKTSRKAQ
jgi:hypothetical protein